LRFDRALETARNPCQISYFRWGGVAAMRCCHQISAILGYVSHPRLSAQIRGKGFVFSDRRDPSPAKPAGRDFGRIYWS
jgi:hypothetical protein